MEERALPGLVVVMSGSAGGLGWSSLTGPAPPAVPELLDLNALSEQFGPRRGTSAAGKPGAAVCSVGGGALRAAPTLALQCASASLLRADGGKQISMSRETPRAALARRGGDVGDEWYVAQARGGRLDAFEELVRRHQLRAFRVAVRLVQDRGDAADVVQDSFIQAWRSLPSFRGDSSFGTWLYRLVVRRAHRRRTLPIPTDVLPQRGSGDAGPAEQTEAQHMLKAAEQALGGLNAEQRVPLLLHAVEAFSYQEVADMLGVSVSAVKSRIYRARLEVLAALQEWT